MTHLKIVADENVAYRVIKALRIKGFEVISISEDNPSITDDNVLQYAYEQKAILLTEDSDFGELIFRKKAPHVGVLYVRLAGVAIDEKIELIVSIYWKIRQMS